MLIPSSLIKSLKSLGVMIISCLMRVANVVFVGLGGDSKGLSPFFWWAVEPWCWCLTILSIIVIADTVDVLLIIVWTLLMQSWLSWGHCWRALDYYVDTVDALLTIIRTLLMRSWQLRGHHQCSLVYNADTINVLLTTIRSIFDGICFIDDDDQKLWMLITCCNCIITLESC